MFLNQQQVESILFNVDQFHPTTNNLIKNKLTEVGGGHQNNDTLYLGIRKNLKEV